MTEYISFQDCLDSPHLYKLCDRSCVPIYRICPCQLDVEYLCNDGKCISRHFLCDGRRHCKNGDDELCQGVVKAASNPMAGSTVAAIVSSCVFLCLVVATLLGIYLYRKCRNSAAQPLSTVKQPLHGERSSEETDTSDRVTEEDRTLLKHKYRTETYHQERETTCSGSPANQLSDYNSNRGHPNAREFRADRIDTSPKNREFEKDLILEQFADGLLCASTPRQPIRHLVHASQSTGNIRQNINLTTKETALLSSADVT